MSVWGLWVDVDALRDLGREVTDVSVALRETTTNVEYDLAPALLPESTAGAAAVRAEQVWQRGLRDLADQVDDFGTKLRTSADNYQSGDQKVIAWMQQLGRGVHAE